MSILFYLLVLSLLVNAGLIYRFRAQLSALYRDEIGAVHNDLVALQKRASAIDTAAKAELAAAEQALTRASVKSDTAGAIAGTLVAAKSSTQALTAALPGNH